MIITTTSCHTNSQKSTTRDIEECVVVRIFIVEIMVSRHDRISITTILFFCITFIDLLGSFALIVSGLKIAPGEK